MPNAPIFSSLHVSNAHTYSICLYKYVLGKTCVVRGADKARSRVYMYELTLCIKGTCITIRGARGWTFVPLSGKVRILPCTNLVSAIIIRYRLAVLMQQCFDKAW